MKIFQFLIKKNGFFPNNPGLPVLLYKGALHLPEKGSGELVKELFEQNDWSNSWTNGIYTYHHYHSITHEVIGIIEGSCTVLLGGEKGIKQKMERGDVLILPAGVGHMNIESTNDFACVGAYPKGVDFDMNYGKEEELGKAEEQIRQVPLPDTDPVFGADGPVLEHWRKKSVKEKIKK